MEPGECHNHVTHVSSWVQVPCQEIALWKEVYGGCHVAPYIRWWLVTCGKEGVLWVAWILECRVKQTGEHFPLHQKRMTASLFGLTLQIHRLLVFIK